jgi:hypothetical protein
MRSGDRPGLQNRRAAGHPVTGGFDPHSLPPFFGEHDQRFGWYRGTGQESRVAVGKYFWTWIRFNGNTKKKIPIAAYKRSVRKFAPENPRDLNSVSGTIGKPIVGLDEYECGKLPKTRPFIQPTFTDSRNPLTSPPSPSMASSAPFQSMRPAVGR